MSYESFDFDGLKLMVASADDILQWSHGEVKKPETINYRTQKPEREGLFCERIFGPVKDWECYCGKYKKIRYKGVVCDKCGVEVTRSEVRRERMGHIDLAVPIAHVWYARGIPSILSLVLDISVSDLEKVIYFAGYIINSVNKDILEETLQNLQKEYQQMEHQIKNEEEKALVSGQYRALRQELESLKPLKVISDTKYYELSLKYGNIVKVGIGAEAIYDLLKQINIDEEIKNLEKEIGDAGKLSTAKHRAMQRCRLFVNMKKAGVEPHFLILTRLPIIPPDLRPMVQLDGGRFAASDLNDLYRRVLNRNNRLKRLISQGAPEVICRNEKRMLQEAVDALIDNKARRERQSATAAGGVRKLRSLSDMLRGKHGRFRQNLLGKRVDYSGRSVIVVGPHLKLDQCGLPKIMALELFKPFVISRLIRDGFVHNVKNASKLIEQGAPEVWDILEQITSKYYVMLNRAPTLHRLGILAFQPILIEGKAIQVHPLVCAGFNADFDGDQMAVHVPLSKPAFEEAQNLMRASANLLKPASGEPTVNPRLDMVFGIYALTFVKDGKKGEGKIFASKNEAIMSYQNGTCELQAKIKVRLSPTKDKEKEIIETTIGRILFNNVLPDEFEFYNQSIDSKILKKIVDRAYKELGPEKTTILVDQLKKIGFTFATISGVSMSVDDIFTPEDKDKIIKASEKQAEELDSQFQRGLITAEEKSLKLIELWTDTKSEVEKEMKEGYAADNPIKLMVDSGARGAMNQVSQLGGMKGLVVNPAGEIIEMPIKANFREGFSAFEYFTSSHGARKGSSDKSLRTSQAGYLTRRLVDVAQDVVIRAKDCGSKKQSIISQRESDEMGIDFYNRILGRSAAKTIKNQKEGTIVKTGEEINEAAIEKIKTGKIEEVAIRTTLHCELPYGICQACYGRDLATGKIVEIGAVVGTMAAQAIGEPGTQLTMRTFHIGGVSGEDITVGLPRIQELFEARVPRFPAILSEIEGKVIVEPGKNETKIQLISLAEESEKIDLPKDYEASVKDNALVKEGQAIAVAEGKKALRAPIAGRLKINGLEMKIVAKNRIAKEYLVPKFIKLKISDGDLVYKGQILTEGNLNLNEAIKLQDREIIERYVIRGVQEIYQLQGQAINEKHIELIIRQMFSRAKILNPVDSAYVEGQIVDRLKLVEDNKKREKKIIFEDLVMGITKVSLKTDSFLSAASFQETTSVLINAAIKGTVDHLKGLKENVIIGRLIPAGRGIQEEKNVNN